VSASTIKAGRAAIEAFLDDKKLSADLKGMQSRLRVAGNLAAKVVGGAMLATAGAAVYKIRQQMLELDAIGKRARTLGMDPGELMQLGYVAQRSAGMTGEAFERGMQRLNKSLQEARDGSGAAARTFRELGIDVEQLASMRAPEQMRVLADAFANVNDDGRRAALTLRIFGRGGADMVNVLSQGGGEIDKLSKKWGDITGLSGGMDTRSIEEANDALADLGLTINAAFKRITLDNAGDLAIALELIAAALVQVNQAGESSGPIRWAADLLWLVSTPLKPWFEELGNTAAEAGKSAGELFAGNLIGGIKSLGRSAKHLAMSIFRPIQAMVGMATGEGETYSDQMEQRRREKLAEGADSQGVKDLTTDQTDAAKAAMELADKQEAFAEQAEKVTEKLRDQVKYFGMTAEEISLYRLRAGEAGDASGELADELEELIEKHRQLKEAAELSDSITRMADSFLEQAEAAGKTSEELEALRMQRLVDNSEADAEEIARLTAAYDELTQARQRADEAAKQQQLRDDVEALTQSWLDMAETIGKSQEEIEEMEIQRLRDRGASQEEVDAAIQALAKVRAARLRADAEAVREGLKTNKQRYADELAELQKMLDAKLLSDAEYEKAREKLREKHGIGQDVVEQRLSVSGTFSSARLGGQFAGLNIEKDQLRVQRSMDKRLEQVARSLRERRGMQVT
jgi:hypothetical protein